ncbi:MAG: aminoglycoside phosphotransferase family protein [Desulfomonilaceae bacterium]
MIEDTSLLERISKAATNIGNPVSFNRLAGDASTRTYFRVIFKDTESAIIMATQEPGSNEERTFVEIQRYLENLGAAVPRIFFHDAASGVLILQDLGDDLLETLAIRTDVEELQNLYILAVDTLVHLQKGALRGTSRCGAFDLAFDETKLMQEMNFFVTHFVRGWSAKRPSSVAVEEMNAFFQKICRELSAEPRFLTHRDYHSRNLIIKNGRLYMIDFQDARMGPAQYDLASLLRDSYLSLPEDLVEQLIVHYLENADHLMDRDYKHFRRIFDIMSLQRNIKALGTFGYQVSVRGCPRYLSSIPRTATNISRNLLKYPEFRDYFPALEEHILGPAFSI